MRVLAVVLLATGLAGCGLLGAVPEAQDEAHVVALTMDGCRYVLAESRGGSFSIVARTEEPLENGDILIGPIRTGSITMDLLPFPQEDGIRIARLDVRAAGLSWTEGRRAWREACTASPL